MRAISIDMHFVIRMVLVRMIQLSSAEMHKYLKFGIQVGEQIQENEKAQVQDFFTLKNKRQDHSCQQRNHHPWQNYIPISTATPKTCTTYLSLN
jgi:hypothetical protein